MFEVKEYPPHGNVRRFFIVRVLTLSGEINIRRIQMRFFIKDFFVSCIRCQTSDKTTDHYLIKIFSN